MVCRPLHWGGQVALTAVAPYVGVQAVLGDPRAIVGVLFSPPGVDEPQAGGPRAGGVEQVDWGVEPCGVVGGRLLATAVVELLVGALVEALPHRCLLWVVVVWKGVVRPMVPVRERRVWHRQAARVAVSKLGGTQRDDIAWGGLQLDVGRPGALDGVLEPHPQGGKGPWYDPVAPCQVTNPGTGHCTSGKMPCAPAITQNILVASARTEAERWWRSVPTRATAACWHRVGTRVSPGARWSCGLCWEASKAYRALSFATWTVTWSRWHAVSESSAMKGATYWVIPPKDREDDILHHFGRRESVGAPVVHHGQAQLVLALQGEFPVRLQLQS